MKKLFLFAAVIAAFTFSSCGNNAKPAANADSASVSTDSAATDTAATAKELVSQLSDKLKSGNADGIATLLTQAQAKIADLAKNNPEQAKEYVSQVQTWILANKDAIKTTLAKVNNSTLTNTVNTALVSVSQIDPSNVVSSLKNSATSAVKDAAESAVNGAAEAKTGVENAASKASDAVNTAKEAVKNAPANVKEKAAEVKDKAVEQTKSAAGDAANKAMKGLGL